MRNEPIQALSPLRHACLGCGGSCQGVFVRLIGPESQRIAEIAQQLGVEAPIVDGALRQVDGQCVFLDERDRCGIHAALGPDAKPMICRQYPTLVVRTESGLRAGIDPGCYTAWRTWRDAPEIDVEAWVAGGSELDAAQQRQEQAFLGIANRSARIAELLRALCPGRPDADGLPEGLASRIATVLRDSEVIRLIGRPEAGSSFRVSLAPLSALVRALDPQSPPRLDRLTPEQEAWAIEATRRMVFLRVMTRLPVQGVALLMLIGAVACSWADPRPERYGPALAAWSRALRAQSFWVELAPSPARLMWLATGVDPTAGPAEQ